MDVEHLSIKVTMNLRSFLAIAGCLTMPIATVAQEPQVTCVSRGEEKGFEDPKTGYLLPCWEGDINLCDIIFSSCWKCRDLCKRTCCKATKTTVFTQSHSTHRPSTGKGEIQPISKGMLYYLFSEHVG